MNNAEMEAINANRVLLETGIALGVIVLVVQFVLLAVELIIRREMVGYLRASVILAESVRVNRKEAIIAKDDTVQRVKDAVKIGVEEVPEKTADLTADRVVERLGGEEVLKKLMLPLAILAGLAGPAMAATTATAAEELRDRNAAIALSWWADQPGDNSR